MSVSPFPALNSEDWDAWAADVDRIVRAVDDGTAIGTVTYDQLPANTIVAIPQNADGTWPDRYSARTDLIFAWMGTDPWPPIVSSGTGGMLDNVDLKWPV